MADANNDDDAAASPGDQRGGDGAIDAASGEKDGAAVDEEVMPSPLPSPLPSSRPEDANDESVDKAEASRKAEGMDAEAEADATEQKRSALACDAEVEDGTRGCKRRDHRKRRDAETDAVDGADETEREQSAPESGKAKTVIDVDEYLESQRLGAKRRSARKDEGNSQPYGLRIQRDGQLGSEPKKTKKNDRADSLAASEVARLQATANAAVQQAMQMRVLAAMRAQHWQQQAEWHSMLDNMQVQSQQAASKARAQVAEPPPVPKTTVFCRHDGCTKHARQGGVCVEHGAAKSRTLCSVAECPNGAVRLGACKRHGANRKCAVTGCANVARKGGVCKRHGGERGREERRGNAPNEAEEAAHRKDEVLRLQQKNLDMEMNSMIEEGRVTGASMEALLAQRRNLELEMGWTEENRRGKRAREMQEHSSEPPEDDSITWSCTRCSTQNEPSRLRCAKCRGWKGGMREGYSPQNKKGGSDTGTASTDSSSPGKKKKPLSSAKIPRRGWKAMYKKLSEYHQQNGHCNVSDSDDADLADWVRGQRKRPWRPELRKQREDLLNEIGFRWFVEERGDGSENTDHETDCDASKKKTVRKDDCDPKNRAVDENNDASKKRKRTATAHGNPPSRDEVYESLESMGNDALDILDELHSRVCKLQDLGVPIPPKTVEILKRAGFILPESDEGYHVGEGGGAGGNLPGNGTRSSKKQRLGPPKFGRNAGRNYWHSAEAAKLFGFKKGDDVLEGLQERVALLRKANETANGWKALVPNNGIEEKYSHYEIMATRHKAQALIKSYLLASKKMNNTNWQDCCKEAALDLNEMGLATGVDAIKKWHVDFRKNNKFGHPTRHIRDGKKAHYHKIFEYFPEAKERFVAMANENIHQMSGRLMKDKIATELLPGLERESRERGCFDDGSPGQNLLVKLLAKPPCGVTATRWLRQCNVQWDPKSTRSGRGGNSYMSQRLREAWASGRFANRRPKRNSALKSNVKEPDVASGGDDDHVADEDVDDVASGDELSVPDGDNMNIMAGEDDDIMADLV